MTVSLVQTREAMLVNARRKQAIDGRAGVFSGKPEAARKGEVHKGLLGQHQIGGMTEIRAKLIPAAKLSGGGEDSPLHCLAINPGAMLDSEHTPKLQAGA